MAKTRTNQPVEGIIEDVNRAIENGEIEVGKELHVYIIKHGTYYNFIYITDNDNITTITDFANDLRTKGYLGEHRYPVDMTEVGTDGVIRVVLGIDVRTNDNTIDGWGIKYTPTISNNAITYTESSLTRIFAGLSGSIIKIL